MTLHRSLRPAAIPGFVFLTATAGMVLAQLPVKHSRDFTLRYECDVAPALANWFQNVGSTGTAPLTVNGWMRFATSPSETLSFTQYLGPWVRAENQAYTMEVSYKTPVRGQFQISVGPAGNAQEVLTIAPGGLQWNIGGVPQQVAVNRANEQHTVRFAAWPGTGSRTVQVWQDGWTVYGPAAGGALSAGSEVVTFGENSAAADCEVNVDHVRMEKGGVFAPFLPALRIVTSSPASAGLTWSTVPGVTYQVQWSGNLTSWSNLGAPVPAMTGNWTMTDAIGGVKARFYRVNESGTGSLEQVFYPGAPPVVTNLPALNETVDPTSIVFFDPVNGPGYENYAINGETDQDQYRSYVRKEVRTAIKHAAARVEAMTAHWPFGNRKPIGLGDMSEANGAIPGTRDGVPAHPVGTHTDGKDIDVAYYQLDAPDNRLRPVCVTVAGGTDQNHCTGAPTTLDVWRSALFLGTLMQHPRLRVIGVDGQAGPLIVSTIGKLIDAGWLPESVRALITQRLAYETTDGGLGWYYFHHHHMHISFRQ